MPNTANSRSRPISSTTTDPQGKVLVSPYLQVATRDFPAYLEPALAPYNYVIDADGHVAVVPETVSPMAASYEGILPPRGQEQ